jgi:hypothetical protein
VVCQDRRGLLGLDDDEAGVRGEQFHQQAVMVGVEVLHQNEGEATGRGQGLQQAPKRVQPAGGGADGHDIHRVSGKKCRRVRHGPALSQRRPFVPGVHGG